MGRKNHMNISRPLETALNARQELYTATSVEDIDRQGKILAIALKSLTDDELYDYMQVARLAHMIAMNAITGGNS
jgi:hypothetical protein